MNNAVNPQKHVDFKAVYKKIFSYVKKNAVMFIAMLAALITSFIVTPDGEYIDYFDFKTLTCLFCVLAVVCALKNVRFFYILARKVVILFKNARMSVLALVYITFIGSMLIANDMALLTFLPLGYLVLSATGKEKYMAFTFIMQNIAANLGGMLTPFGNPQNLYLYSRFNIPVGEFMSIMLLPFAISVALVTSPASDCISEGIIILVAFPSAAFANASRLFIEITACEGAASFIILIKLSR